MTVPEPNRFYQEVLEEYCGPDRTGKHERSFSLIMKVKCVSGRQVNLIWCKNHSVDEDDRTLVSDIPLKFCDLCFVFRFLFRLQVCF